MFLMNSVLLVFPIGLTDLSDRYLTYNQTGAALLK
jgi:hypothetical protein